MAKNAKIDLQGLAAAFFQLGNPLMSDAAKRTIRVFLQKSNPDTLSTTVTSPLVLESLQGEASCSGFCELIKEIVPRKEQLSFIDKLLEAPVAEENEEIISNLASGLEGRYVGDTRGSS